MNSGIMNSRTYKIRPPIYDEALYFTIVGDDKPESFFINSKEMSGYQWIVSLMTSYSRQIAAGIPIANVIADMSEAFDPNGDYIVPGEDGLKVKSVVHHIGIILERHVASFN